MRELSGKTIRPKCKYYSECGGCQLQYLSYEDQLVIKENQVKKLMGNLWVPNKSILSCKETARKQVAF